MTNKAYQTDLNKITYQANSKLPNKPAELIYQNKPSKQTLQTNMNYGLLNCMCAERVHECSAKRQLYFPPRTCTYARTPYTCKTIHSDNTTTKSHQDLYLHHAKDQTHANTDRVCVWGDSRPDPDPL